MLNILFVDTQLYSEIMLVVCNLLKSPEAKQSVISFLYVCMVNTIYLFSFVETPRKFMVAELSIRKLGSPSVLIILTNNSYAG